MGQKIKGKDYLLYIEKGGKNVPVCCGRELSITINQDVIEATKAPYSRWKSFIAGDLSFSISSSTLVTMVGVDVNDLFAKIESGESVEFVMMANSEKRVFFSGRMIIQTLTEAGSYQDIINYNLTAIGDGPMKNLNPYSIVFLEDGAGNLIEDGEGNPIHYQVHGDLNELDFDTEC